MTELELMQQLAAPFEEREVKWRVQQNGDVNGRPWVRVIAYIDNTAIMARLDAVVGIGGWQNRFEQFEGGAICGLSLELGEGQWITKWDGSGVTQTEPFKGALSGAMKRAGVMWGIGRYLHGMGEMFATIVIEGDVKWRDARRIKGAPYRWLPPALPAKYLPSAPAQAAQTAQTAQASAPVAVTNARTTMTKVGEVVQKIAPPPSTVAAAEAQRVIGTAGQVRLPGTNKVLMGFGGSEIFAVPREHLPVIRERLNESRPVQYAAVIAAIDEYLEATRTD